MSPRQRPFVRSQDSPSPEKKRFLGSCEAALKRDGLVTWGRRLKVRCLRRQRETLPSTCFFKEEEADLGDDGGKRVVERSRVPFGGEVRKKWKEEEADLGNDEEKRVVERSCVSSDGKVRKKRKEEEADVGDDDEKRLVERSCVSFDGKVRKKRKEEEADLGDDDAKGVVERSCVSFRCKVRKKRKYEETDLGDDDEKLVVERSCVSFGGKVRKKRKDGRPESKDRWSKERYLSAEAKLIDIMQTKGAVIGNPILRPELRAEARKHIGDTGLLDHLLKHMAGKAVHEKDVRFRRQHNPEGAMEYWLEPANLVEIRKQAGVQDPYWNPPAWWKPGDGAVMDAACAKEMRRLKEEMASMKRYASAWNNP